MSRENVEIVQQGLEAWQRDDLTTWLSTLDPAVEWRTALERLVEGIGSFYRGLEGMRELWTVYRTELEDFRIEAQGLRDGRRPRCAARSNSVARSSERDRA
jgi:ketosteroid isomerase-like protein